MKRLKKRNILTQRMNPEEGLVWISNNQNILGTTEDTRSWTGCEVLLWIMVNLRR